jgi:hypothetical protein
MTTTRTINSIQFNNSIAVNESNVVSGDPTSAGAIANVALGGQFRYDGTSGNGPAITADFHGQVALIAGALTLDLTALADAILGTVTMAGLKLRHIQLAAPGTNAGALTIKPGASNGYTGWAGSGGLILSPSDQAVLGPLNGTIAIDGTHKTLDLTGTGTDKLNLVMMFG